MRSPSNPMRTCDLGADRAGVGESPVPSEPKRARLAGNRHPPSDNLVGLSEPLVSRRDLRCILSGAAGRFGAVRRAPSRERPPLYGTQT
jgi:hypothetical protein